jgi:hypothetical protein
MLQLGFEERTAVSGNEFTLWITCGRRDRVVDDRESDRSRRPAYAALDRQIPRAGDGTTDT